MFDRKRGTDEELLSSETLPEVIATWLSENYFHNFDAESATARYRGEVRSPQANDPDAPATSTAYYVNVDDKSDRDLVNLNVADEPLELPS